MISFLAPTKSDKLYRKRAAKSIASSTQTYSKQPKRYVDGVYPAFIKSGSGPFVQDYLGHQYVDYAASLGANLLGHANPHVTEKVIERVKAGTLFSQPNGLEIDLAEKIKELFPSIGLMRFLKSGSEAVSAGVKIARAYTGRDIVFSSGYHGWHDWSTPITEMNAGTPANLYPTIKEFKYNDYDGLVKLFEMFSNNVSCVVIDPYVFDEPTNDFLGKMIRLAHKHGALVLFDEVVTGIRWSAYSVQNTYGVKPDLTALGKALGNGFPISVIGGRAAIMRVLDDDCFVSSTFGGDLVGISAALATLDVAKSSDLWVRLDESGSMLQNGLNELAIKHDLPIVCNGSPFRQRMVYPSNEHKALFWQECIKRGIMFGAAQHTTLSHTPAIIEQTLDVVDDVMGTIKLMWDKPKEWLEGNPPQAVTTIAKQRS